MAFSRAIAETVIVDRLGPLMSVAELAVTIVGTNASLNDPLAWATREVGGATAAYNTVTDAELGALSDTVLDDLLTLSEYRTLQNILGALNAVDITAGPRSEKLHQFVEQCEGMLERLEDTVAELVTPMTAGYISLDLAEHNEERL